MPRLADEIARAVGGAHDQFMLGAIADLAENLKRAECFEISTDVARAIYTVNNSRPSTILAALPFSRPPYKYTWVEWAAAEVNLILGRNESDDKEMPQRIGALIEELIPGVFAVTWAWHHPGKGVNLCPVSVLMAWDVEGLNTFRSIQRDPVVEEAAARLFGEKRRVAPQQQYTVDQIKESAATITSWRPYLNNPRELDAIIELENWDLVTGSAYCAKFMVMLAKQLPSDQFDDIRGTWYEDLAGEPCFVRAFLILLNTKNGVVSSREDLSRLNRARKKSGKKELREFQITRLNLSQHAARAAGQRRATPAEVRQHYVRGHFKVRKSGVFWWSPFVRGNSLDAAPREHYVVA